MGLTLIENGAAPALAQALIPSRPLTPGEQYRFHFDMTKCIGWRSCEVACNEQNGNPAEIQWRRIGELEGGTYPNTQRTYLSMGCNHCLSSGTVLAAFFGPRLAHTYGWQHVYGIAALFMLLPLLTMIVFAKEPPDIEHQSLAPHLKCLVELDGWYFDLIYIITFDGFLGLATFLPSLFVAQFHIAKSEAGTLTMCATLIGRTARVLGGWFADKVGGTTTLSAVFLVAIASIFDLVSSPSLALTRMLFMLCFAALGAGNGATLQLVPLRWPATTAIAGGMIGEIGALGGGILPNVFGLSRQHTGSFAAGFAAYAGFALVVLVVLRLVSRRWTRTWVGRGGRVLAGVATITSWRAAARSLRCDSEAASDRPLRRHD